MSADQYIVNAQVSVNRSVWACNLKYKNPGVDNPFPTDKEREEYILREVKSAIQDLTQYVNLVTRNTLQNAFKPMT